MRYVPRADGSRFSAAALAGTVHLLFFSLLVFGLSWQIRSPSPVSVELWRIAPATEQPSPPPPPPPPPAVQPRPAPPPPPKAEQTPAPQPDIALEKERQKREEAERVRKQREEQAQRDKKQREELQQEERDRLDREARRELQEADKRRLDDQLARESAQLETELTKAEAASPADSAASNEWKARIAAKIRANIVVPDGLLGNPDAVFDVDQLPTGEVFRVKLRKSSGFPAYDEAVERAIRKSSPLPKPERAGLFERSLKLTFRPQDR